MSTDTLKKIEMRNDGRDSERFETLLKQVVSVSKKEVLEREAKEKQEKEKRPIKERA